MTININIKRDVLIYPPLDGFEIKQSLKLMLMALGYANNTSWLLNIYLVGDKTIEKYNNELFDLSGPTNVLSFPSGQNEPFDTQSNINADTFQLIGELVVSVDTIKRESFLYAQDEKEHFLWLLAHGLAHLGSPDLLNQGGLDHGDKHDSLSAKAFEAGKSVIEF